jgi:hypothetical protein
MTDDLDIRITQAILDRSRELGCPISPDLAEEFAQAAREAIRLAIVR